MATPPRKDGPKTPAKGTAITPSVQTSGTASPVDETLRALGGWRAATLAEVRRLIQEAAPGIEEACAWIKPTNPLGVPTWSCGGIVCTGEAYKEVVKLTFARGASLEDPHHLFNASLEGSTRRAIDLREGESLDATAFKRLVQAAVAENQRRRVK